MVLILMPGLSGNSPLQPTTALFAETVVLTSTWDGTSAPSHRSTGSERERERERRETKRCLLVFFPGPWLPRGRSKTTTTKFSEVERPKATLRQALLSIDLGIFALGLFSILLVT